MKKLLILTTLFLAACGGSPTASNSTNKAMNSANSEKTAIEKPEKTVDSTPVKLDYEQMKSTSKETYESYKGRTLILKGMLDKWSTDQAYFVGDPRVTCKGDFAEYKEAVEAFTKKPQWIHTDFRGTLEEVKENGYDVYLTLTDCVIMKMEK